MLLYFFFDFRAGTGIANTPVGMLRSLLLQLVEKSTAVKQYVLQKCSHRAGGQWPNLEAELLDFICESMKSLNLFVCGFIDGLDEYKGRLGKLVDTILLLQRRSGMKMCLASRPEPEIAFKLRIESLSMQQHNRATIRAYSEAALSGLDAHISQQDLLAVARLIGNDADGVILWARFAVDEVVCAILQGCTLKDALAWLGSFPPDLEEFYARTLRQLNTTQELQAAVMFFILEHWNGSFQCHGWYKNLDVESFMFLCSRTLQTLDPTTNFCSDHDEGRFKRTVHAMLRGLVEFMPQFNVPLVPKLVHKSLLTFLHGNEDYASLDNRISQVVDKKVLGPVFHAQTLIMASEVFDPSGAQVLYDGPIWARKNLKHCFKCDGSSHFTFSANTVIRSISSLTDYNTLDEPENVHWRVGAMQTQLFWQYWRQHRGLLSSDFLERHKSSSLVMENPEIFECIYLGVAKAFHVVLAPLSDQLTAEDWAILFAVSLSSFSVISSYGECKEQRHHNATCQMLLTVLKSMSQAAHFLVLCVASSEIPVFDAVLSAIEAAPNIIDDKIPSSAWWIHPESSTMLCWVVSPYHAHCKPTQQRRLAILLSTGQDINGRIYEKGNVMDALFDAQLWEPNAFLAHPELNNVTHLNMNRKMPHFSRAKFEVLIESGFHISTKTNCERYLRSAERLLENYGSIDIDPALAHMYDEDYVPVIQQLKDFAMPFLESTLRSLN